MQESEVRPSQRLASYLSRIKLASFRFKRSEYNIHAVREFNFNGDHGSQEVLIDSHARKRTSQAPEVYKKKVDILQCLEICLGKTKYV